MSKRMKNKISFFVTAVMITLVAWVLFSFIEINIHNMESGYEYSSANFFMVINQNMGE